MPRCKYTGLIRNRLVQYHRLQSSRLTLLFPISPLGLLMYASLGM